MTNDNGPTSIQNSILSNNDSTSYIADGVLTEYNYLAPTLNSKRGHTTWNCTLLQSMPACPGTQTSICHLALVD